MARAEAPGSIVKNGAGTLQIQGGGTGNSYTGATLINDGVAVLFKNAGVAAIPGGGLTIGDGSGPARSAQVVVRNSNQIADTSSVTLNSDALLDLATFNTVETVAALSGLAGSAIIMGPDSVLAFGTTTNTTFAGSVTGGGTLTKQGSGTVTLNGALAVTTLNGNSGTLNVNSNATGSTVNAAATSTINVGTTQTLSGLNIADGGLVSIVSAGFSPEAPAASENPFAAFQGDSSAASGGSSSAFSGGQAPLAVPEPGSTGLLLMGVLGLLGRSRRQKK